MSQAASIPPSVTGACVTIGNFDGVHLGHQALIRHARQLASPQGLALTLITFWPHPRELLQGDHAAITDREERRRFLGALGIDHFIEMPFTSRLAAMPAAAFVASYLLPLKMRQLVVGHDFRLGRDREGDIGQLRELGSAMGFQVHQAHATRANGAIISSTSVRQRIRAGDMEGAAQLLGRHYTIQGTVTHGFGRGAQLGFPTANLATGNILLPPDGVYASFAHARNRIFMAVTNVGDNPTFDGPKRVIESFLLDCDQDLYDHNLRLEFVARLRPERKFANGAELGTQISRDVDTAKTILNAAKPDCAPARLAEAIL